ncbi:MAG TPA: AAA family ATPase [Candidatus Saccharimonadales bacterium]|nr:AAA family ATPase [Candidatus Saccharimonadales bacterium]
MNNPSKLIVLRGPSAVGKSTIAKLLHERVANKTALIEQDHYRHVMFNNPHSELEAARQVMFAGIQAALEHGYDVITEGILSMGKYKTYFDALLEVHPKNNYFFYFDVSFDETMTRHATRDKSVHFNADAMREWFERSGPTGYAGECVISQNLTAEQAVAFVSQEAALQLKKD